MKNSYQASFYKLNQIYIKSYRYQLLIATGIEQGKRFLPAYYPWDEGVGRGE